MLGAVGEAIQKAIAFIKEMLGKLLKWIKELALKFVNWIKGKVKSALAAIGGWLRKVGKWFAELFEKAWGWVKKKFMLTPEEEVLWLEYQEKLVLALEPHQAKGITKSDLKPIFKGLNEQYKAVAKWPSFILGHGPKWHLRVRRKKSIWPRVVGQVTRDHESRFAAGVKAAKKALGRLKMLGEFTTPNIDAALARVRDEYGFSALSARFEPDEDAFRITAEMSPGQSWRTDAKRPTSNGTLDAISPSRHVVLEPLVRNRLVKSPAYGSPDPWDRVQVIKARPTAPGKRAVSAYIRGHLVSGWWTGGGTENLTPITRKANAEMETRVETPVWARLANPLAKRPVFKYEAEAIGSASGAILRPRDVGKKNRESIVAERLLAREIVVRVTELHYDPGKGRWIKLGKVDEHRFDNVPPFPPGKGD
jgi:hypothetical protein